MLDEWPSHTGPAAAVIVTSSLSIIQQRSLERTCAPQQARPTLPMPPRPAVAARADTGPSSLPQSLRAVHWDCQHEQQAASKRHNQLRVGSEMCLQGCDSALVPCVMDDVLTEKVRETAAAVLYERAVGLTSST